MDIPSNWGAFATKLQVIGVTGSFEKTPQAKMLGLRQSSSDYFGGPHSDFKRQPKGG